MSYSRHESICLRLYCILFRTSSRLIQRIQKLMVVATVLIPIFLCYLDGTGDADSRRVDKLIRDANTFPGVVRQPPVVEVRIPTRRLARASIIHSQTNNHAQITAQSTLSNIQEGQRIRINSPRVGVQFPGQASSMQTSKWSLMTSYQLPLKFERQIRRHVNGTKGHFKG